MSFFGLTALGSGNQFENNMTVVVQTLEGVPNAKWDEAFNEYALAGNPNLCEELRVENPAEVVLRADLVSIARRVLGGRELEKSEAAAFTKTFNTDTSGLIGREEFFTAVENLRALCNNPASLTNYTSFRHMSDDRTRHRRIDKDLMQCYDKPLTGNSEYGWYSKQVRTPVGVVGAPLYIGHQHTEVTENEGRSIKDYYGMS